MKKNHMGKREYLTYAAWKRACIKKGANAFEGDKDICEALNTTRTPCEEQWQDTGGPDLCIGQWDGEFGVVYLAAGE